MRALHRPDDVAGRRGRQRQVAAGSGARDRSADGVFDHGVEQHDLEIRAAFRQLVRQRAPHVGPDQLREIQRIFLGVRDLGEGLEDAAQVADAHAFFDQAAQDVGEQDHGHGLWNDLAHGRWPDLFELIEQVLRLRDAEEVRGAAPQDRQRLFDQKRRQVAVGQPRRYEDGFRRHLPQAEHDGAIRQIVADPDAAARQRNAQVPEEDLLHRRCGGPDPRPSQLSAAGIVFEQRRQVGAHVEGPRHDDRHEARRRLRVFAALHRFADARIAGGHPARARPRRQEEQHTDDQEGQGRQARDERQDHHEHAGDAQRARDSEDLRRELLAEGCVGFFARNPRHQDAGRGGQYQRRDLGDQAVTDGEQAVALHARRPAPCPSARPRWRRRPGG